MLLAEYADMLEPMSTDVFAVVSDPTRRRILRAVRDGERPVNDIVAELGVSQPTVSKHLRVLREAGLVRMHAHGQRRLYALEAEPLEEIVAWVRVLAPEAAAEAAESTTATPSGDVSAETAPAPAGDSGATAAEGDASAPERPDAPTAEAPSDETPSEDAAVEDSSHDASAPSADSPDAPAPATSADAEPGPLRPAPVRHRPRRGPGVVFQPLVLPEDPARQTASDQADADQEPSAPAPESLGRNHSAPNDAAPKSTAPETLEPSPTGPGRSEVPASQGSGPQEPESGRHEPTSPAPAREEPETAPAAPDRGAQDEHHGVPETLDPLVVRPREDEDQDGDHRQPRFLASLFSRKRGRP